MVRNRLRIPGITTSSFLMRILRNEISNHHVTVGTGLRSKQKESTVPKVIFFHAVSDRELWLSKAADRVEVFAPWASDVTDHVSADGGSMVAVSANVHDMEGMEAAMATEGMAAKKAEHGVIEPVALFIQHE
jgi:hypothetical protein